jgi:hypothetical protein
VAIVVGTSVSGT